ncbi:MAG: hypothetical protein ACI9WU_001216 [Myxococcota bacterium]
MRRLANISLALTLLLALSGCGVDALLFTEFTRGSQVEVPGAGNNFIHGGSSSMGAGADVTFFSAGGATLLDLAQSTDAQGRFTTTVSASSELLNLVVEVANGSRSTLGIMPRVDKKSSVLDADRTFVMGGAIPAMADLGRTSTLVTLVVLAQSRYGSPTVPLAAITPEDVGSLAGEIIQKLDDNEPELLAVNDMLGRLMVGGATVAPIFVPFPAADGNYVDASGLAPGLDYTGDGTADVDGAAFDEALALAVSVLTGVETCFADDTIRLVIMVDFNEGLLDRNCAAIDPWKWTDNEPNRQMFITGSIHEDTPNCDTEEPPCLESAVADAFSQEMGDFVPNIAQMYDDGSNGDLVAGDNIWTRTWDAPWFDAGADNARWVRVHYKYTWGNPGQLWTSTEEWPGNSRLLELRDTDGDRVIVRYDQYGDESTNKDAANLLAPAKGGCGKVSWASENPPEKCVNDALENWIDTDGDCVLDAAPQTGAVTPITEPCGGDAL